MKVTKHFILRMFAICFMAKIVMETCNFGFPWKMTRGVDFILVYYERLLYSDADRPSSSGGSRFGGGRSISQDQNS